MNAEQEKNTERYLSTGELMDVLSISRSTVYRLIAEGMPCMKVGSVNRFSRDRVLAWLEGGDESQQAKAILQEAQEILEKVRNKQKQTEAKKDRL
jgi:excisionase family DNA binding protein